MFNEGITRYVTDELVFANDLGIIDLCVPEPGSLGMVLCFMGCVNVEFPERIKNLDPTVRRLAQTMMSGSWFH